MPAVALPPTPPVMLHVTHQHADWILAQLAPRGRIVALSKGRLSLTDLLAAAVKRTGPARVTVCVWEVGRHDVEALVELHARGAFLSARFIVPPASNDADAAHYDRFREIFGPECIIEAACHAKIALVENDAWSVAIRGSLNMYACGDIESFDIDDSPEICALVNEYAEDPETEASYPKPKEARERADRLVAAHVRAGCRFFGLTAGYDLPAIVDALLAVTGPARVTIATAYMAAASSKRIAEMPGSRLLFARASVTLDHKGSAAKAATEAFGPERVRIAMTHAKIITIRNAGWNLTIRGSANMCRNLRVENFDITDDAAIADQADAFVDHFFEGTPEGLHVPQTIIGRVMRAALGDTSAAEPTGPARGPIKLSERDVGSRLLRLGRLTPTSAAAPGVPVHSVGLLLRLPLNGFCTVATATPATFSECPRHADEATTARGPITLPRAPAAGLQLLLPLPEAPTRPAAAGSSPPRV